MEHEIEEQKLFRLLGQETGITREWNEDLAFEAEDRAFEGFEEVGYGPQPDGSFKGISHPTQMERESRLGPEWAGKGVAEIAAWHYGFTDPVQATADAWMRSETHRNVLMDTRFKHMGIGIYAYLPQGETVVRWYFVAWLSINVPVTPEEQDMILLPTQIFRPGTVASFSAGKTYSLYRITGSGMLERKTITPQADVAYATPCKTALNGDFNYQGTYLAEGPYVGWIVSGWTPPAAIITPADPQEEINSLEERIARMKDLALDIWNVS